MASISALRFSKRARLFAFCAKAKLRGKRKLRA